MYVPPSFCSTVPCLSPTEVFEIELNVDDKASGSCKISWVCLVVGFPLGVFKELLGDVLGASLIEEIFGELPKFRGGFSWLRHGK